MLTVTVADVVEVALPDAGDAESHPLPPETVEVETEKFKLPEPALRTSMDADGGFPPLATV